MASTLHAYSLDTLAPIRALIDGVRRQRGEAPVHGVTPGIVVADPGAGWFPAAELIDGSRLDAFLAAGALRWPGEPHVSGALAWKSYAYWTVLPAVLGYATGAVPDVSADNVLARLHVRAPFVEIGLVRAAFPAARLRETLLDGHLDPLAERLHARIRVGHRTLMGSVASAVCYALARASGPLSTLFGDTAAVAFADEILTDLGLADLVDFGPDERGQLAVRRRTCCLAFAADTPKVCTGCCIPSGLGRNAQDSPRRDAQDGRRLSH